MTERETHPNASHYRMPYYFTDSDNSAPDGGGKHGIAFRGIWHWDKDLIIYYGDRNNEDSGAFVNGWCSRWDAENYSIIIETWLKREDAQKFRNSITIGATKELFTILGVPHYFDTTYNGRNTLKIRPNLYKKKVIEENPEDATIPSTLPYIRKEITCFPRTITMGPIKDTDSGWIFVKLEAYISSSSI